MTPEEIAWAAGLFEGEGTICPGVHGSIRMCLAMCDEDVVQRFALLVGAGSVTGPIRGSGRNTPEHWKSNYAWTLYTYSDVERILTEFWPYLGERRRARAQELLDDYRSKPHRLRGKYAQLSLF